MAEQQNGAERLQRMIQSDFEGVLSRWLDGLRRRSWTLRRGRDPDSDDSGPLPLELIQERCRHFLTDLRAALADAPDLQIGTPSFREAVKVLAFTAGWMAGAGMPITDVVALVHSLREALEGEGPDLFFELLTVVATESFAASCDQRASAAYREAMEKSQIVCDLNPELPLLFLVGDPDRHAVDDAVGRLMMLATMRQARHAVVDSSGLIWPDRVLHDVHQILGEHGQAAGVKVYLAGITAPLGRTLSEGPGVSLHEHLRDAVKAALSVGGASWSF